MMATMSVCKTMVPLFMALLLAFQAVAQELSSTLHSTMYGAQYALGGEELVFTCVVRGSNSMAWTSDEYIGVGLRLPLFSVQGVGHQVNAFGNNQTVAVIVNVTTGNDLTIVSQLHIRVTSTYPVAFVQCVNSGANTANSTSFFLAGTTLACDRQSVCPGDTVICTCITGNSSSLIWTINGNRLTLTSNNSLLTQQNVPGSNGFAMLTESSDINGIRVITSDITATASLNDPEIVLTCKNVDRAMIQPKIIPTSPTEKCLVNPTDQDTSGITSTDPGSETASVRNTCAGPIAAAVVVPLIIIMIVITVAIPLIILTPKKIRRDYEAELEKKHQTIEGLKEEKRRLNEEQSNLQKELQEKKGEVDTLSVNVKEKDELMKQKQVELTELKDNMAKQKKSAIVKARVELDKLKEQALADLEKTMNENQERVLKAMETRLKTEIEQALEKEKSIHKDQAVTHMKKISSDLKSKLEKEIQDALTELNGTTDKEIKKVSEDRKEGWFESLKNLLLSALSS